jgi:oligopeptide transport system substrate-binding protein
MRGLMSRLSFAVVLCLTVMLGGSSSARAEDDNRKAEFVFVNRGEVSTLDPNRMSWLQDIRIGYAIYEGLMQFDPATVLPIPGAAERIELSDDKKVYTFHLRENAKWSNGDPVTTADFVFAWRRMLQTPGDYTYLLYYIVGAEDYEKAFAADPKSADFSKVMVEALDARTLRVTLRNPTPFFLDLCAFPPMFPLNERAMQPFAETDNRGVVTYKGEWIRPGNLIGNGAYVLQSWEPKVGQLLVASETYWDKASVKSKSIRALSVDDPTLAFQMYERGEVDWLADVTGDIASRMRDEGRKDIHIFPSFGTYFYTFNCSEKLPGDRPNPLADVRVRQALSMAIDKKPIVANITKLDEATTDLYVTPSFPGYKHPQGLPYNVELARQLLAEAGYPEGKGFPQLSLTFNPEGNNHKLIAEYINNQWKQNLGISMRLDSVEIVQFRERLKNKDYDIARASWYGDYMDVSTFTDKYKSTSLNNDSNWKNAEYDKLLEQAEVEPDAQKRLDLLAEAEQILIDEQPILPLYYYVNSFAHRENVKGINQNPKLMIMLKAISTERSTGGK